MVHSKIIKTVSGTLDSSFLATGHPPLAHILKFLISLLLRSRCTPRFSLLVFALDDFPLTIFWSRTGATGDLSHRVLSIFKQRIEIGAQLAGSKISYKCLGVFNSVGKGQRFLLLFQTLAYPSQWCRSLDFLGTVDLPSWV